MMESKKTHRIFISLLVLLSFVLVTYSVGVKAEMPAPLDPPEKVVVAYVPIMKFATM